MKKKNGFTLIEVIVSLAILGIISIAFLTSMTNHFKFLNNTKKITQDVFLVQREMEEQIDLVKQEIIDLKKGVAVLDPRPLIKKTIFGSALGGIEVSYYEVKGSYKNRNYFTLVSNIKPDPLELVQLETIDVKLNQGFNKVAYGYGMSNFSIIGNFKNAGSKYDHLLNQVEWYVSSKEYNMPMPKDPTFNIKDNLDYNSYYFPLFPRDFELIDNETVYKFGSSENTFNKLSEFAGRHVIYSVTPAAKSGKLGIQKVTKPIFVSGLPVIDKLILHFDAAYIDILESNEVQKSGTNLFLNKWIDISSIIGNTSPTEFGDKGSYNNPTVKRTDMGLGFIGQYVQFNDGQYVVINQNIANKTITIFSVLKNRSKTVETQYLKNAGIILKTAPNLAESEYEWHYEWDVIYSTDNTLIIGGNNTDISEVIIYEGEVDEINRSLIQKYLSEKYKYPIITGDILELKDIIKEIKVGDNFELPNMVYAEMERGTYKYVSVSWSGTYNTNVEGVYIMTGTALANPTKKMTYTLNVVNN